AARRRSPDRGASVRPAGAARSWFPVFRRARESAGDGELSGAGICYSRGVTASEQHNDTTSDDAEGPGLCRALDCCQLNRSTLREVRVVLLLHVRQGQTQLRAVDAAALVRGSRHGARGLTEPDQVEQVLPFEELLAPP